MSTKPEMSNQQHTPGPWYAVGWQVEIEDDSEPDICNVHPGNFGQIIGSRTEAELLANARLIAASPDLLSSLVEIMSSYPGSMLDKDIKARAYAAIAKAKGE